jgi:hypothetical protein
LPGDQPRCPSWDNGWGPSSRNGMCFFTGFLGTQVVDSDGICIFVYQAIEDSIGEGGIDQEGMPVANR